MTEARKYIRKSRRDHKMSHPPEMRKGIRFNSDSCVERKICIMYLEETTGIYDIVRRPKIEDVPMEWIKENLGRCFDALCEADWHFTNPEKWGINKRHWRK